MPNPEISLDPNAHYGYARSAPLQATFEQAAQSLLESDPWTNPDGSKPATGPELRADLALEGGGVKGIGLVGAILVLDEAGYKIQRVAGTSAGAIAASLVAALVQSGQDMVNLKKYLSSLQFERFMAKGKIHEFLDRVGGKIGEDLADASILTHQMGLYTGEYLYEWLTPILQDLKVETFGDLKLSQVDDPGMSLPDERQYRLLVHVSDVTRGELARLPWDYNEYGHAADVMPVAEAVRASMSIPFFFEPVTFKALPADVSLPAPDGSKVWQHYDGGTVTWVDGGMLRNFPIDAFDRIDGAPSRWPTIGIKLSSLRSAFPATDACEHALGVGARCLDTMMNEWDGHHVDETTAARTIFVDNGGVTATEFHLTPPQQDMLFANGVAAATTFVIETARAGGIPRTADASRAMRTRSRQGPT